MADEMKESNGVSSDESDDDEWEEMIEYDNDDAMMQVKCLFCDEWFADGASKVLEHCDAIHGFRFRDVKQKFGLDYYGCIKLVNYIRKTNPSVTSIAEIGFPPPWESEDFLKPVLPNDGLLQSEFDDSEEDDNCEDDQKPDSVVTIPHSQYLKLLNRLQAAEERASQAQAALSTAVDDIQQLRAVAQDSLLVDENVCSNSSRNKSDEQTCPPDTDRGYFTSYAQFDIHEEMLKDKVRTESYKDFIYGNPSIFKDKVVLDVGCGTGILSMFAASAGARHVIGIDQSDIIYQAMDIIRENGLEKKITLIKGKAECVDLPVDKVDIIISEWMGYFLLFECMLDTVLFARDKWLAPGGSVFPNKCSILVAAMSNSDAQQRKMEFWNNVYGFKMSCMKVSLFKEPTVQIVDPASLLSNTCIVKSINVDSCRAEELEFTSCFRLKATRDGLCTAIVTHFDIFFESFGGKEVCFSTSPTAHPTHWKQTVFYFEDPFHVLKGQVLVGSLTCRKNVNYPRALDVKIEITSDSDGAVFVKQDYVLE